MLLKIFSCLNSNKAAGMDEILAKLLEEAADMLDYLLCKVRNFSIKSSVFSEEYEIAKIKLLSATNSFTCTLSISHTYCYST